jgi:hypothetical protein
MGNPVIGICPICESDLKVTKLTCSNCHTEITGDFELSRLSYLKKEELAFVEIFIKNRGNIKTIERELNISYPTVKKTLDNVISKLGYDTIEIEIEEYDEEKANILDKLKNKEISVIEATELLKKR